MAGATLPATDANGIITEGPFAGLKLAEVVEFAATSVAAGTEAPKPTAPAAAPNAPPASPADTLAAAANARLTPMEQFTLSRFEADDETAFAATVTDYDTVLKPDEPTWRQKIAAVKKNMPAAQRAQAGFHRFVYMNLKAQDPEIQKHIFATAPPAPAPDAPPDLAAPPVAPPAAPPSAPPPIAPRAAPAPVAPSTPRAAPAAPGARVPVLKGSHKTLALAERWSMKHDDYLIMLEDRGTTQDEINKLSVTQSQSTAAQARKSVYDR